MTTAQSHGAQAPAGRPTTARRPAPRATHSRALAAGICAALLVIVGGGTARAQAANSSEEVIEAVRTRAGELSLVRRRLDEAVTIIVKLDGRVLAEKEASEEGGGYTGASVYSAYPKAAPRYVLVGLTGGGLVCASKFAVVDLSSRAGARVTADFGNCSDTPRVSYRNNSLTVTFPAGPRKHDPGTHYVGPGQVWSYGGGRLRRIGRGS